jgi:YggT family protein
MDGVRDFVNALFLVYFICILLRILLSWFQLPYNRYWSPVVRFLEDVTEPYLSIFRRIIPPIGMFDLSPIVAIFVLRLIAQPIVNRALGG